MTKPETTIPACVACGVEAPLGPNEALPEIAEGEGTVVSGRASRNALFRYSILWRGPHSETESRIATWLPRIVASFESVWWIAVWSAGEPVTIRDAMLVRRFERQKATVIKAGNGSLNIAAIPFENSIGWDAVGTSGTMFVVAGGPPPADDLAQLFVTDIWQRSLKGGRIAPSEQVFEWLDVGRRALVYRRRDHVGHAGLVAITPRPLELPVVVGQVPMQMFYGADAQNVWLDFQ